jgi:hypothetical protein
MAWHERLLDSHLGVNAGTNFQSAIQGVIHLSVADISADILFPNRLQTEKFEQYRGRTGGGSRSHAQQNVERWHAMANSKAMTPLARGTRMGEDDAYALGHGSRGDKTMPSPLSWLGTTRPMHRHSSHPAVPTPGQGQRPTVQHLHVRRLPAQPKRFGSDLSLGLVITSKETNHHGIRIEIHRG